MKDNKPLVLIMCGGQSLRLWPLSQYKSKNFLDIFGFSPLEVTIKRFLKITSASNIFLVANKKEKHVLTKIKLIKKNNIILEPQSKNTAAAILLALNVLKKYSDKPLIISPVDHLIENEKEFYKALKKSLKIAEKSYICTLGIKPKAPNPNLGYIQAAKNKDKEALSVKRFIEKPSVSFAKKLISKGNCFYNSGMFIASISTLFGEYKKYYPEYNYFIKNCSKNKLSFLYKKLKNIPFDKAVMEKSKKVKLVKANFFWKDFGSWKAIYEILLKDKNKNASRGNVFMNNSKNNLIFLDNPKKKVLVMGINDIAFIDTKDYTLLASQESLDNLKSALSAFSQL